MDFLLFFFSKSTSSASSSSTSPSWASEPLIAKSSTRSTYNTFSEKSKPSHRKALFDRVPDCEPGERAMSRSNPARRRCDGSGVATLDLLLLLDRYGCFS
jgi:hypothetical protein